MALGRSIDSVVDWSVRPSFVLVFAFVCGTFEMAMSLPPITDVTLCI